MIFYNQWKRPPKNPEIMDPLTITESAGYIPPKKQIENLINAGKRLQAWRKEMYDFPDSENVDDAFEDPTRGPGFDLADASREASAVNARLRSQAAAAKTKGSNDTAVTSKIDPGASSEVSTKVDKKKNEPKNEPKAD